MQKIKGLLISLSCGVLFVFLLLPRRELMNHSILRSFVVPPARLRFPGEDQFDKYMRQLYGPEESLLRLRRQDVWSLVVEDFGIPGLDLRAIATIFSGILVSLLVYRIGFKKSI